MFIANSALFALLAGLILGADLPSDYRLPQAPGSHVQKQQAGGDFTTFKSGKPLIATTYFYWYDDATKAHIIDDDGSDALTDHPPKLEGMSYNNVDWHAGELADMIEAGIDVAMPVYWGTPGQNPAAGFSMAGLPKLVAARERLLAQGKTPPRIGMFYDTSTLQWNEKGYHVDLTTPAGRRWFYGTIRDCFSLIPSHHRATIDGRPLVFLYGHDFAKNVDEKLFPAVRKMFEEDFGTDLYIVKMQSWPGRADSRYQWGGALTPQLLDTAAIVPGYDHSAVPGRKPLVRERKDGEFYCFAWKMLLAMPPENRPWLLHIETWNELHEGTDICHSREYGRKYIELTRQYADMFHEGRQVDRPFDVLSAHDKILATPDESVGLTIDRQFNSDGLIELETIKGKKAWSTRRNRHSPHRYMYFDAEDFFVPGGDGEVQLTIEYFDAGPDSFTVQYDACDPTTGPFQQKFDMCFKDGHTQKITGTNTWKKLTARLPHARFFNGCNGVDMRIRSIGKDISVAGISISRSGE